MPERSIRCPQCEKRHAFDEAAQAREGGKAFTCACGRSLRVPGAASLRGIYDSPADVAAAAKRRAQREDPALAGPWRHERWLVLGERSSFPSRCVECGAPVDDLREVPVALPQKQSAIPMPKLAHAVVALHNMKHLHAAVGTCARHTPFMRPERLSVLLGVCSLPPMVAAGTAPLWMRHVFPGIAIYAVAFLALIGGAIYVATRKGAIRADAVDDEGRVFLAGFGDAYLATLPPLEPIRTSGGGRVR